MKYCIYVTYLDKEGKQHTKWIDGASNKREAEEIKCIYEKEQERIRNEFDDYYCLKEIKIQKEKHPIMIPFIIIGIFIAACLMISDYRDEKSGRVDMQKSLAIENNYPTKELGMEDGETYEVKIIAVYKADATRGSLLSVILEQEGEIKYMDLYVDRQIDIESAYQLQQVKLNKTYILTKNRNHITLEEKR